MASCWLDESGLMSQYLHISKLRAGPGFARVQSSLRFLFRGFRLSFDFNFWSAILDLVIWKTGEDHMVSSDGRSGSCP